MEPPKSFHFKRDSEDEHAHFGLRTHKIIKVRLLLFRAAGMVSNVRDDTFDLGTGYLLNHGTAQLYIQS